MGRHPIATVGELLALLRAAREWDDADDVTVVDHGLQCAWALRRHRPADLGLQIAGLVHDLGHGPAGAADHASVGADLLRPLLGARVARLVELHVAAKRYLVATDADYRLSLSPTSGTTLEVQGGAMTSAEVADFERDPHHRDAVVLRRADEAAKVVGLAVPGLEWWVPGIEAVTAAAWAGR